VILFVGNKTQVPLINLRLTPQFSSDTIEGVKSDAPTTVPPRAQVQQMFTLTCKGPFTGSPPFALEWTMNGQPTYLRILFPVTMSKFIEPFVLKSEDVFKRWRSITGTPREEVFTVKPKSLILSDLVAQLGHLLDPNAPSVEMPKNATGLRLAVLSGIDPNANNLVLAGIFHYVGKQQGILARIETVSSTGEAKVTIRTTDGTVTAGLRELIPQAFTA